MKRIRSLIRQALHLDESPRRTALAFALGVFIAFSPSYGLHTLSAVFCSWAFRLNFLALMTGTLLNNPWTMVPILGATFWTGFQIMGIPDVPALHWRDVSVETFYQQVRPYAVPFFIGGLTLSIIGAAVAYPLAYYFVNQYRIRKAHAGTAEGRLPRGSS
jgi:uncharacterized protein (DUF2062 family)